MWHGPPAPEEFAVPPRRGVSEAASVYDQMAAGSSAHELTRLAQQLPPAQRKALVRFIRDFAGGAPSKARPDPFEPAETASSGRRRKKTGIADG